MLKALGEAVERGSKPLAEGAGRAAEKEGLRAGRVIDRATVGFGPAEATVRAEEGASKVMKLNEGIQYDPHTGEVMHGPPEPLAPRHGPGIAPGLTPAEDWMALPEPHLQTRSEFAWDPRTWWHGRYAESLPPIEDTTNPMASGIHAGGREAMEERRMHLGEGRDMTKWRSFPMRLTGEAANEAYMPGADEMANWVPREKTQFYKNQVEARGQISAQIPSREAVKTHGQFVEQALAEGKKVPEHVLQEHKLLAGREYDPHLAGEHGPAYPLPAYAERARVISNVKQTREARYARAEALSEPNSARARRLKKRVQKRVRFHNGKAVVIMDEGD